MLFSSIDFFKNNCILDYVCIIIMYVQTLVMEGKCNFYTKVTSIFYP